MRTEDEIRSELRAHQAARESFLQQQQQASLAGQHREAMTLFECAQLTAHKIQTLGWVLGEEEHS